MTKLVRDRLPLATILPFSLPSMAFYSVSLALVVYLPNYFTRDLMVSLSIVGGVWMAVRLLDAPVDILLSLAMDRTRTIIGRYRLWLIAGTPVLMLATWRLFMAPAHFSAGYLLLWLFVFYLGNSATTLAHPAWGANLASSYNDRSRLFGILAAVGTCGTILAMGFEAFSKQLHLSEVGAVRAMGWLVISILPLCVAIASAATPEPIAAQSARRRRIDPKSLWRVISRPGVLRLFGSQMAVTLGPGWMSAIYLFFFQDARRFTRPQATLLLAAYILAQIPGSLLVSALAQRIGKHRALIACTCGFSLGVLSIFIIPKANFLATLPALLWCGTMAAGFGLMISAMLADVSDEIRLEVGEQHTSLVYAVNGLAVKIAGALSIGIAFPLLQWLGYHARGPNTPAAITHLEISFLAGPIFFVMLGGACVIGWKLDARRHAEIRLRLDARDAEEAASLEAPLAAVQGPTLAV
ncbi:MAG: MFS transporter [Caulobacteraceae bacterium]